MNQTTLAISIAVKVFYSCNVLWFQSRVRHSSTQIGYTVSEIELQPTGYSDRTGNDQFTSNITGNDQFTSNITGNDHFTSNITGNDHFTSNITGNDQFTSNTAPFFLNLGNGLMPELPGHFLHK
jgi:hypothetical protein